MLFLVTHIFLQKKNTAKDFYVFIWATSFSEATCLWMKVHVMLINFVSGQVIGASSAFCLARKMAKSMFSVIMVCNLGLLLK